MVAHTRVLSPCTCSTSAVVTMILNVIALWKQEARNPARTAFHLPQPDFRKSWASFIEGEQARRRLMALGLGTAAFSMQDVLLEPYGGQILQLSVSATTSLTAMLAFGGLVGFTYASRVLSRGTDPFRMASNGVIFGIPGSVRFAKRSLVRAKLNP
jgi:BCD family chlorophyll transporter-like MFS transporter